MRKTQTQTKFPFALDYKKEFGGSLLEGVRKSKRPLSTKNPIHLIIKSNRNDVFKPQNVSLKQLIQRQAEKFGIKLYDYAINHSHLHLIIQIQHRDDYVKFIRTITSILAQRLRDSFPDLKEIFELRPFTRVISWGRDFANALKYTVLNRMEAFGFIRRDKKKKERRHKGSSD